jgi:hypothetical protein
MWEFLQLLGDTIFCTGGAHKSSKNERAPQLPLCKFLHHDISPVNEKMAARSTGKISIFGFVIQSLFWVSRVNCEEWQ